MKIGYARVSTQDQNLALQLDALQKVGCERIFEEKVSSRKERPELDRTLDHLRKGDSLVVWKLDRLGRSLKELIKIVESLQEREIAFVSLQDGIDTTTTTGKLTFHIFAALAEYERNIISERTKAGLKAARARGRKGGRPKGLSDQAKEKQRVAKILHQDHSMTPKQICEQLGISRSTLYRYLKSD